jgi:hypothetical protein
MSKVAMTGITMALVGGCHFYFSKFRWLGFQINYPRLVRNIRPQGAVSHILWRVAVIYLTIPKRGPSL